MAYIRRYLLEIGVNDNTNSPFVSYSIPSNIREDVEKMVKDVDLELRPMTIKQKTFTKHDWF